MKDPERLYEAIGEIREDLIAEAENKHLVQRHGVLRKLAAACLILVVLVLPVSAEYANGYVSNLLAPLYGCAQTEIVDSIGVPLDASVTVGDYTLTADAVIGDRYSIAVVFSLSRVDGKPLPEDIRFDQWEIYGVRWNRGYTSFDYNADRTKLYITDQREGNQALFRLKRDVRVEARNLVIWVRGDGEDIPLQEGTWQLKFTARYEDTMETVWRGKQEVTGENGDKFTIRKMELSPLGLHLKLKGPGDYYENLMEMEKNTFSISLLMKDGSRIPVEFGMGGKGKEDGEFYEMTCRAGFDTPIPKENIRAVLVCDTEFPIE